MNAAAAKFLFSTPTNSTAGTAFTVKVAVQDAYGNKVKNYFGTIRFSSTSGITGLPADYSFTPDDAGTHTFSVSLSGSGNTTLSVSMWPTRHSPRAVWSASRAAAGVVEAAAVGARKPDSDS